MTSTDVRAVFCRDELTPGGALGGIGGEAVAGWFLPVPGISLAVFLAVDVVLGSRSLVAVKG